MALLALMLICHFTMILFGIYYTHDSLKERKEGLFWLNLAVTIYFVIRFVQILTEVLL